MYIKCGQTYNKCTVCMYISVRFECLYTLYISINQNTYLILFLREFVFWVVQHFRETLHFILVFLHVLNLVHVHFVHELVHCRHTGDFNWLILKNRCEIIFEIENYLSSWCFTERSLRWVAFVWGDHEVVRSTSEQSKCWAKFKAVLKESNSTKNVEPESGTGHCHNQPTHVSNVTNRFGTNQRKNNVVVLLTWENG